MADTLIPAQGPDPMEPFGDPLHAAARSIFTSSLAKCNIGDSFDRHLHFEENTLVHHPFPGLQGVLKPVRIPLDLFRLIRVIAIGKAAAPMLDALLTRLPRGLPYRALCASPERPSRRNWRIHAFAAGHPVPNRESFDAARLALKMLRQSHSDTFVFFLLSGGGSALLELPLDESISLEDTIAFHEALVSAGATIHEMNIVRKHFSAVKGGRLALAAPEATKLTLQVADVPLKHLDALASGPTIPDRSTVAECREILDRYHLLERFPAPVRDFFSSVRMEETPGAKHVPEAGPPGLSRGPFRPGANSALRAMLRPAAASATPKDPSGFSTLSLDTLLSSHDLVNAARDHAHQLGYRVVIDNTCDDWPCEAAALYLIRRMVELRARHPRLCLISSGEVTVRLPGRSIEAPLPGSSAEGRSAARIGVGGRNQQFALASAFVLAGEENQLAAESHSFLHAVIERGPSGPAHSASGQYSVCVFSAGTDGVDGNSPVAGAIADPTTLARARALHFDPLDSLRSFDACPLFSALGDTVVTGKTGHNLRDLRLLFCTAEAG